MRRYIKYILILFISSCATDKVKHSDNSSIDKDSVDKVDIIDSIKTDQKDYGIIDTAKLRISIDSFLTARLNENIELRIDLDTNYKWNEYYVYPHLENSLYTQKLKVRPKPHELFLFTIFKTVYGSELSADKAFEMSRKKADKRIVENNLPGFSKAYDYIMISDSIIYSINANCPFSFRDIRIIKRIVKESITGLEIKDSIHCNCGNLCDEI